MTKPPNTTLGWPLATEMIVVRIRWFGVLMGFILVHTRTGLNAPLMLQAFLALGAVYALLDTVYQRRGRVFLERWPGFVSAMEAVFIALLCFYDTGISSPFRWYYLLSLICTAIRYAPRVAWITFGLDCLSLLALTLAEGAAPDAIGALLVTMVILAWSTWATVALASLLKATSDQLRFANAALEKQSLELEQRVAERTEALRASQARVIHQEKMAAFGLLAAGIAHEVGNPLAAISSLIQILQRRNRDPYTTEKLELAGRQLDRIRRTIRELVDFSRPACTSPGRVRLCDAVDEALAIAKYYLRTKQRRITPALAEPNATVLAVHDHLVQVVLNLILNAVDATALGGRIEIQGGLSESQTAWLSVEDDGRGIPPESRGRLFQPYFTTKPLGTGLGLYVSRQLVKEMGGTLTFVPGEESGSRFLIRLPAVEPSLPAPVPLMVSTPAHGEEGVPR